MAFVFGLQTLHSIDVTKIFRLKGLKAKNKGHTNFYECCDLTKKVYLTRDRISSNNISLGQFKLARILMSVRTITEIANKLSLISDVLGIQEFGFWVQRGTK